MGLIVPDAVEQYLAGLNRCSDPVLDEHRARQASRSCRWSTPRSARCCACSRRRSARARILEIGTAIGYSGIWLAGALPPDGMLLTMEMTPERAQRSARELRARRSRRAGQRHRRRRAANAGEGLGAVRSDFPGRRQAAVRAAAGSAGRAAPAGRPAGHRQRALGRRGRAGFVAHAEAAARRTRGRSPNTTNESRRIRS